MGIHRSGSQPAIRLMASIMSMEVVTFRTLAHRSEKSRRAESSKRMRDASRSIGRQEKTNRPSGRMTRRPSSRKLYVSSCSMWVNTEKAEIMSADPSGKSNVVPRCLSQRTVQLGVPSSSSSRDCARRSMVSDTSVPMYSPPSIHRATSHASRPIPQPRSTSVSVGRRPWSTRISSSTAPSLRSPTTVSSVCDVACDS